MDGGFAMGASSIAREEQRGFIVATIGQAAHWNGNPMAFAELIHRMVEQGVASVACADVGFELR